LTFVAASKIVNSDKCREQVSRYHHHSRNGEVKDCTWPVCITTFRQRQG